VTVPAETTVTVLAHGVSVIGHAVSETVIAHATTEWAPTPTVIAVSPVMYTKTDRSPVDRVAARFIHHDHNCVDLDNLRQCETRRCNYPKCATVLQVVYHLFGM
jgi:hypothetical protein